MEIETADVERQFGLQHLGRSCDMLGALGEGVSREGGAAVPQHGHRSGAGLVPRSQIERIAGGTLLEQARQARVNQLPGSLSGRRRT